MPRNTVTEQIYHITIRNLEIASGPSFISSPRGGHGSREILMKSLPYSHETFIFTLGAPHEEVQGRQTKLHPGFTMGKLVQPSPGISEIEILTLFCPNEGCPPELPHRAVDVIVYFYFLHFFTKIKKDGICVKKLSKGDTACLFHLPLQALVASITNIFLKFYNDGFISTSDSEQKNKQTEKNMSFIAVYHKFTNPKKNTKKNMIMTV